MKTKTINVPLDQLQPGDVVTIPPLTVDAILSGDPPFAQLRNGLWSSLDRLELLGATATREVPDEPKYPLNGRAAYNAMMDGAVIERVKYHNAGVFVRRKWCDGKFMVQWWFGKDAGRWGVSENMKDQLNTELKRFAELCAEVRPKWNVQIIPPSRDDDFPSVTVEGVDSYDTYSRADCGAMIFWLLDEFPTVGYRALPHALGTTVYSNRPPGVGLSVNVSENCSLHHTSLYVVLKSVNAILEREAQS